MDIRDEKDIKRELGLTTRQINDLQREIDDQPSDVVKILARDSLETKARALRWVLCTKEA